MRRRGGVKVASVPIIKIAMIGTMFTGKTCLITQFINNFCEFRYNETRDVKFIIIIKNIPENRRYK